MNYKNSSFYPIGTPGVSWGELERAEWLSRQAVKRSYVDEVVASLNSLRYGFSIDQYGALSFDADRYPLLALKTVDWDSSLPIALVTGGVHGYETSGVLGAVRFLQTRAADYSKCFNLIVVPCVAPWGYETINRWNPFAADPNRAFHVDGDSEESGLLMHYLKDDVHDVLVHIDLHETTDTDYSEFVPALAARDGAQLENGCIPDGFYVVGDSARAVPSFHKAIVSSVELVTHIAKADKNGQIIGADLAQHGVVDYDAGPLGLCMGMTSAEYVATTEVYPDSPRTSAERCVAAQVAAVVGGLDYVAHQSR